MRLACNIAILLVEKYYKFAHDLADEYLVVEPSEVTATDQSKGMEAMARGRWSQFRF